MNLTRRAALAAASAAVAVPPAAFAQSLTAITIGGVPEESIAAALWALANGAFRKNGLDVTIEAQKSGSATAAAVAGGSYAFGKSSLMSLLVAHGHNIPIVIVAPGGVYDGHDANEGFIVRADAPFKTGADLNGKTIAVSAINDLYAIGLKAWVDAHGGDSSTLKLVELPVSAIAPALLAARIDAGGTIDPDLQLALEGGKVRVMFEPNGAIAPQFMYTAWFATTDYTRTSRATCDRFRAALREAGAYLNEHPQASVDLLAKFSATEPAVVAKSHRVRSALTVDARQIQPLINIAAKYKAIPAAFDAKELIDPAIR